MMMNLLRNLFEFGNFNCLSHFSCYKGEFITLNLPKSKLSPVLIAADVIQLMHSESVGLLCINFKMIEKLLKSVFWERGLILWNFRNIIEILL